MFFDYDEDGWLDLFVGNYLQFDPRTAHCKDSAGAPDYCGPDNFEPLPDRLFRNRGGGRFEDVTRAAGLRSGFGPALGAVAADYDRDGDLDLYVTNDGMPNNLWINLGGGRFEDRALLDGAAVDASGRAGASMGVDAGDYDGDGDLDLFVTKLISEGSTLWRNESGGSFADVTVGSGLGWAEPAAHRLRRGLDRRRERRLARSLRRQRSGQEDRVAGARRRSVSPARAQPALPQRRRSRRRGRRRSAHLRRGDEEECGPALALSEVSRGVIVGDVDDDGDLDLVVTNNLGPVRLLLDQAANSVPWLGLVLRERPPRRDAPGATVELVLDDGTVLLRRVRIDGSYAGANDPRILFGLGGRARPVTVRVTWADGGVEEWPAPAVGRYAELARGGGRTTSP